MTREKALEVIKSHPFLFASFPDNVLEALDILIEQEPTTKNDCNTCTYSDETNGSHCYECVKGIRNYYEPRKGYWILSKDYEGCPVWQCSLCRSKFDDGTKFCPECGADMRESEKV